MKRVVAGTLIAIAVFVVTGSVGLAMLAAFLFGMAAAMLSRSISYTTPGHVPLLWAGPAWLATAVSCSPIAFGKMVALPLSPMRRRLSMFPRAGTTGAVLFLSSLGMGVAANRAGPQSDRFGERPVFVTGFVLHVVTLGSGGQHVAAQPVGIRRECGERRLQAMGEIARAVTENPHAVLDPSALDGGTADARMLRFAHLVREDAVRPTVRHDVVDGDEQDMALLGQPQQVIDVAAQVRRYGRTSIKKRDPLIGRQRQGVVEQG